MKGTWVIIAGFIIAATASLAVASGDGPSVSVDFKKATIQDVADFLAVKAGTNIVVEKGVSGSVNLRLSDTDWFDVMDIAAKQVGCSVETDEDGIYHVVTPHFSFTTKAEGVSLQQVISLLAQQSSQNIVVAPDVDAIIHFNLEDVPWQIALDTIVKTAGPFTVVKDEAGVFRVVKSTSLSEQKETKVFRLKYIQAPSEYKPKITSQFTEKQDGQSSGGSGSGGKDLKDTFTLFKALNQVVIGKGSVEYDYDSNAFIVTTTMPLLEEVAEIIRLVDVQPDQVFVDVKFVTTGHTDLLNAGVRYPKGFMISANGGSMVHRLPFTLGNGGWEDEVSVTGDGPTPEDVDAFLGSSSPYTFGVIDFSNISPVLEFLKNDSKSEVVQAPQLTVVDNKTATIFSGEEIHFAEEFSTTNQGGQLSRGIREATANSPVKVGTQLLIMPHLVPDSDRIVLSLIPTNESLTGTSSPTVPGFERFNVGDSSIDLPRISSRTVVTTLILEDGQTAVLGGLISHNKSENVTKLPFFGDIPIIGWLFKNRQANESINNLYIFITVRIIRNQTDVNTIYREYEVDGANVKPYKPVWNNPAEPVEPEKSGKADDAPKAVMVEKPVTEADPADAASEQANACAAKPSSNTPVAPAAPVSPEASSAPAVTAVKVTPVAATDATAAKVEAVPATDDKK